MPVKNTVRAFYANQYYHVYNRGWNRTTIFLDARDYLYFENLLARSISLPRTKDPKGREYKWLGDQLDLNAYCLMPNHFHMLIYQRQEWAITELLQSVSTAYSLYFNKRYGRRGSLFENRFKSVEVTRDEQLQHITRYIHLNHKDFRTWAFSSYRDYLNSEDARDWLTPKPILGLFDSTVQYEAFVLDYEDAQRERDVLKRELADAT